MMRKAAAHKKNREAKKGFVIDARTQYENEETAQRQVTVTSDASHSPENHARAGGPNKVLPPCVANKVQRQTAGGNESKPEKKGSQARSPEPYYLLLETLNTMGERNDDPDLINDEGDAVEEYHMKFQTFFSSPDEEEVITQALLVILCGTPIFTVRRPAPWETFDAWLSPLNPVWLIERLRNDSFEAYTAISRQLSVSTFPGEHHRGGDRGHRARQGSTQLRRSRRAGINRPRQKPRAGADRE